ncbi:MAG TPA: NAD(P)/FAD-dependent oxidoreductase [Thermoleophilaceae bacterium]|jgi:phytoene desaturase
MKTRHRGDNDGFDAIVIGSGPGGLTTAAYLAANGMRTLVLEQYDVAGGCTHAFRRKRQWEFDVGLHYVGDCGNPEGIIPTVLRGVGVDDRVDWLEMDPDGFDTLVFPDLVFRVPRGWERYRERLVETFPADAAGIRKCTRILERLGHEAVGPNGLMFEPPMTLRGALQMPFVARSSMRWGIHATLGDLFDACRLGVEARAVLAGQSGLYGSPPSRAPALLHAILVDHYVRGGAYYPRGGGQVPAALLVDVIRTHGGTVRTRARVDEILIRRGRVAGVRLTDGETIGAPVVVSAADIKRTFLELIAPEHVGRRRLRRVDGYRMAPALFQVFLGLDVDLRDRMPNTNWYWSPSYDPELGYAATRGRELPDEPNTYTVSASVKDPHSPEIAPPGCSSMAIMGLAPPDYAYWQVDKGPAAGERYSRNRDYQAVKEGIADRLIETTARRIPPLADLRDRILWRESATPITQERYTLSTDGASYGIELAVDQWALRRPSPKTRIPGLFLAGSSTFSCHGLPGTMVGGAAAAGAVLGRNLLKEVRDGAVFADRSRITAGGPGWDPFLSCRRLSVKKPPRSRPEREPAGAR